MNISKRLVKALALVIVLVFVLNLSISPASAKHFYDISSNHWALDEINYVSDNGYMNGTPTNTFFSPSTSLNRAMLVTVLHRKAGSPSVSVNIPFVDVPNGQYYTSAVKWGYYCGIIHGTSNTTFEPMKDVSRQDAAVFLNRYASIIGGYDASANAVVLTFSDSHLISSYALPAVKWAVYNQVLNGRQNNTFAPLDSMTRAEFAAVITRYGTNIDKIIVTEDNPNISNNGNSFTQSESVGHYYISDQHFNRLVEYVNSLYSQQPNKAASVINTLTAKRNKTYEHFPGCCFGISAVTALDKKGKIAFNENFADYTSKMYEITNNNFSLETESAFNYYQLSQYIGNLKGTQGSNSQHTIANDLNHAYNVVKSNRGYTLFSYFWNATNNQGEVITHGHAVLAKSVSKSGTEYTFNVFNPNQNANNSAELKINENGLLNSTTQLTKIYVLNDFSLYNSIDIDFYDNSNIVSQMMNAMPVTSVETKGDSKNACIRNDTMEWEYTEEKKNVPPDAVYLVVQLNDTFQIKNAENEILLWNGDSFSGDMEVYEYVITSEGENEACYMMIGVDESKSFKYVPTHNTAKTFIAVGNANYYMGVSGKGLSLAEVYIDQNKWYTTGNIENLELLFSTGDYHSPFLTFSADSAQDVIMNWIDNRFIVNGIFENGSFKSSQPNEETDIQYCFDSRSSQFYDIQEDHTIGKSDFEAMLNT